MADMAYINAFLNRQGVEGPCVTIGDIPARPGNFYGRPDQRPERYTAIGASGVTIATGCDMGQTDVPSLKGYGVSDPLVEKLKPYIGLKRAAAIAKLAKYPLAISPTDAQELDTCVHNGYLDRYVRPAYERASGVSFDSLPRQAQAVVFSVCYQKGCGGVRRDWPKLWSYLVGRKWADAACELRTGFREYKVRRTMEGNLLVELP